MKIYCFFAENPPYTPFKRRNTKAKCLDKGEKY